MLLMLVGNALSSEAFRSIDSFEKLSCIYEVSPAVFTSELRKGAEEVPSIIPPTPAMNNRPVTRVLRVSIFRYLGASNSFAIARYFFSASSHTC